MPPDVSHANQPQGLAEGEQESFDQDDLSRRETLELIRAYYRIQDPSIRKRVFELVKAVATQSGRPD